MQFTPLTEQETNTVLENSRQKGVYDEYFKGFLGANIGGWQVPTDEGDFKNRKPATLKTGFESAIKRILESKEEDAPKDAAKQVRVVMQGDNVYLIRRAVEEAEAA
jgi:hypothetical protein